MYFKITRGNNRLPGKFAHALNIKLYLETSILRPASFVASSSYFQCETNKQISNYRLNNISINLHVSDATLQKITSIKHRNKQLVLQLYFITHINKHII